MFRSVPLAARELQPLGVSRHLSVAESAGSPSTFAVMSLSCLSTLVLLAAGTAWLGLPRNWFPQKDFDSSVGAAPTAIFPSWVEVPHLTGPLAQQDDATGLITTEGQRSFLDPNPSDVAEQPAFLAPRINPRVPLIGLAPLDTARLSREQLPAWDGGADRSSGSTETPILSGEATPRPPSTPQPTETRTEIAQTRAGPVNPAIIPAPPAVSGIAPPASAVVMRSATQAGVPTSTAPGETIGPENVRKATDQSAGATPAQRDGPVSPTVKSVPSTRARSFERPQPAATTTRGRAPYRDTEETASIVGSSRRARARIEAGAVAHSSAHRVSAENTTSPTPASSPQWMLPSVLAPTQ